MPFSRPFCIFLTYFPVRGTDSKKREYHINMTRKPTRLFYIILAVLLIFTGCRQSEQSGAAPEQNVEILVSAASSLTNAFEEIGHIYEAETGHEVYFNFGGSGVLQLQIERGAPVDVFASAGQQQMDVLESQGLIVEKTRRNFIRNVLVVIVPENSELQLELFTGLGSHELERIALGNPKTAPVGQYAKQSLINLNLWNKLKHKLIFAENVHQVLYYVARGEVAAGIVYASVAAMAESEVTIAAKAPKSAHDPIIYPIAVLKRSENKTAAKQFIDLVLSKRGQKILMSYGFNSVQ